MQDINWRIIINYDDIFKKLNWYFCSEVTSLDTIQISFFTPPHPPLLPPCYPGYRAAPAQQEQLDQSRAQETERQEPLGEERVGAIVPPPPS